MLAGSVNAADLLVEVRGVESDAGTLRMALYKDPKTFLKERESLLSRSQPAHVGTQSFLLEGLAPGRYAVILYHDADDNGDMNRFLGMIPTEGYGLSTNPTIYGPPSFDDADFLLPEQGLKLEIDLRY
jgi:uncharacterized protein (DUF2141 family)